MAGYIKYNNSIRIIFHSKKMLPFIIVESPIARKLHSHMLYKCREQMSGQTLCWVPGDSG